MVYFRLTACYNDLFLKNIHVQQLSSNIKGCYISDGYNVGSLSSLSIFSNGKDVNVEKLRWRKKWQNSAQDSTEMKLY